MTRPMTLLPALAALLLAWAPLSAAAMNKCIANGAVTYQQGPCPSDGIRKAPPSVQELNAAEKARAGTVASAPAAARATAVSSSGAARFACDGRRTCSQMSSCAEARYFLANCPGVKMDGDRNGTPCEKQWCSR